VPYLLGIHSSCVIRMFPVLLIEKQVGIVYDTVLYTSKLMTCRQLTKLKSDP